MLKTARLVVIVPGYGMALAQAQYKVKQLADALEARGAKVVYGIHPEAGRAPGHISVLLAETNLEFDHLLDMEAANSILSAADVAVVIGANDIVNPASQIAVIEVAKARNVIICNLDDKPGFAGRANPLFMRPGIIMLPGDAAISTGYLVDLLTEYVRQPPIASNPL